MTYSILGRDLASGDVGGAVQSAWYSSGAGVVWAEAGVGAAATQAIGDRAFGPLSLQMMTTGATPTQVIAALVTGDATPGVHQIGVIDLASTPTAFTGADCVPHAEHEAGVKSGAPAVDDWAPACSLNRNLANRLPFLGSDAGRPWTGASDSSPGRTDAPPGTSRRQRGNPARGSGAGRRRGGLAVA